MEFLATFMEFCIKYITFLMDILATFMEYYRGSVSAKMGEVLSNLGVLFLDELPHFSKKSVLEALREPLEDNKILISK